MVDLLNDDSQEAYDAGYYPFSLFLSRFFFKRPKVDYGDGSYTNMQSVTKLFTLDNKQKRMTPATESCTLCHLNEGKVCNSCCKCVDCKKDFGKHCDSCFVAAGGFISTIEIAAVDKSVSNNASKRSKKYIYLST